ncbi:uncharacterized protein SCODWIG_01256 [Saccharomycodes ludwigii]|uniref:U1-type domain-containing protein n=1 Tax=Saccharomycodes ludwigii TaxID=36035 RepID=A0A376B475_9ASCO|nr:uncharacterized protein SCODWIG_01256 [Saccharomycodes ludwigii]
MDYSNRIGSKKGGGGMASSSIQNLQTKKQVDDLLIGERIPFITEYQADHNNDEQLQQQDTELDRKNPYIYKNRSGKLVCKLCNTMHMSWTSVERHLKGKKHGLSLLIRSKNSGNKGNHANKELSREEKKEQKLTAKLENIRNNEINIKREPLNEKDWNLVYVKNDQGDLGVLIKVNYGVNQGIWNDNTPPFIRLVDKVEIEQNHEDNENCNKDIDQNYLVISFPPFENIAVGIPSKLKLKYNNYNNDTRNDGALKIFIDDLNNQCCYWDRDNGQFFVQVFFQ